MVTIACLLLASSFAAVADPPASQPLPPEIAKELDYFVGQWSLEGQGAKGPMKSSWTMRWAPGRQALLVEYRRDEPGQVIRGNGVWGWDSGTGEIVWHAFYSDPGLEHIRMKIDKTGILKGKYYGSLEGKKGEADCVLRKEPPDQWTFKTTGMAAAGLGELDVRLTRVKPAGKPADEPTAADYMNFWKRFFAGEWDFRRFEGERNTGTGTWSCRPAPNGGCMLFAGTTNGKEDDRTVAGYDPRTRSWKEVTFTGNGDHLTLHYRVPRATLAGDVRGRTLKGEGELVTAAGKVEHADVEVRIRDNDHWTFSATNRVRDGEKLPDVKYENTRRKK